MKVGFIGVGNMGGPMCRNIVKTSNHQVTVFDLNPAAVKTCTDLGATAAKSLAEVTKGADVVMTSLPMPKDVEAVTLGDGGILANIGKGQTYIDLSTNAPSMVKKIGAAMAAKGIAMLDAPVSGGTTGAEAATIAIMVGGDKKVFDDALPVLQSFSANVIHMGGLGSGTVAKLVNNMLSFCNMAALSEGMMLGTSAGLDPDKLLHVIANASGNSNAIKNFTLRALPGNYSPPSFALNLAYKDLHLALELGDELGVPLQQGASTHNLQRLARGMGSRSRRQLLRAARLRDHAGPQGQAVAAYLVEICRIGIEAQAGTGWHAELGLPAREAAVAVHVHVRLGLDDGEVGDLFIAARTCRVASAAGPMNGVCGAIETPSGASNAMARRTSDTPPIMQMSGCTTPTEGALA